MILKYGGIRVNLKYEELECFNLDLIHFQEEKGIITKREIDEKILSQVRIF